QVIGELLSNVESVLSCLPYHLNIELACADDADETRRQAALRRHQAARGLRQLDDEIGCGNVFGQIEIMNAGKMGGAR
ncbi:hypothetical protein AB9F35_36775, partial [Rhizobium leguminosarum]